MPTPLAICLEHLEAKSPAERYLRCVALGGRQPGLRVDAAGEVLWRSDDAVACELWVSLDEKLILYRPAGAAPVTMWRAGRALEVPEGKPVVMLDQDEFLAGGRRLRIHVHGAAPGVYEPSWLPVAEAQPVRKPMRAAAAAVALGVALAGGVEVRCSPPAPPNPQPGSPGWSEPDAGAPPDDPNVAPAEDAAATPEVEVRVAPPSVAPMPPPPPPPPPPIEVRDNPPGAPVTIYDETTGQKTDRNGGGGVR
jgi:hypothetical protein